MNYMNRNAMPCLPKPKDKLFEDTLLLITMYGDPGNYSAILSRKIQPQHTVPILNQIYT